MLYGTKALVKVLGGGDTGGAHLAEGGAPVELNSTAFGTPVRSIKPISDCGTTSHVSFVMVTPFTWLAATLMPALLSWLTQ